MIMISESPGGLGTYHPWIRGNYCIINSHDLETELENNHFLKR